MFNFLLGLFLIGLMLFLFYKIYKILEKPKYIK